MKHSIRLLNLSELLGYSTCSSPKNLQLIKNIRVDKNINKNRLKKNKGKVTR